jgi:dTDP-4-dehydrorhamnose 3,5-epimerase
MASFVETEITGCFTYKSNLFKDHRGSFLKMFSQDIFASQGVNIPVAEIFFSNSHKGVLRGMHFQKPPFDHAKVVSCLSGKVLDVVLDLRKSSKSYGKAIGVELSPESETTLFIPRGCAHGFYAFEDNSLMCYAVETVHNKEADSGVLWNSFGFSWPNKEVLISERDQSFLEFSKFESPFQ